MSSGRYPFCFALAAWLACGTAWAEGEGTSWTDPPARPASQEPANPADVKPAETKPPESARSERAPEPARNEPTQAQSPPAPTQTAPTQPAPTQAERRQEQIRRAVARSTAQREAEAAARAARTPRRSVVERPASVQHFVERVAPPRERRAALRRTLRRPVYGYADPAPVYGRYGAEPVMRGQQVWDEDAMPDLRARRIAQARSAGYLVMRSRSYAYPDGTVVRRFSPFGGDDFYE